MASSNRSNIKDEKISKKRKLKSTNKSEALSPINFETSIRVRKSERISKKVSFSKFKNTKTTPLIIDCEGDLEVHTQHQKMSEGVNKMNDNKAHIDHDSDFVSSDDQYVILPGRKTPIKKKNVNTTNDNKKSKPQDSGHTGGHTENENQPYYHFDGKKILQRISPSNLITWFSTFSDSQRKTINEIGFGKVLNLKLESIPTSLAFWLVHNYNHHTSTLNVGSRLIHITQELVNELMGIPMGSIQVEDKRPSDKDPVVAEWRSQFINTSWIKRPYVMEFFKRISNVKESNRNFILNFMVAFFTIAGETNKNSVVNQRFLTSLKSHINIKDFNWCEYVINCLKKNKETWKPDAHFNGPLLLLALVVAGDIQKRKKKGSNLHVIEWLTRGTLTNIENYMASSNISKGKKRKQHHGSNESKKGKHNDSNYDNVIENTMIVPYGVSNDTEKNELLRVDHEAENPNFQENNMHVVDDDEVICAEYIESQEQLYEVSSSGNHLLIPVISQYDPPKNTATNDEDNHMEHHNLSEETLSDRNINDDVDEAFVEKQDLNQGYANETNASLNEARNEEHSIFDKLNCLFKDLEDTYTNLTNLMRKCIVEYPNHEFVNEKKCHWDLIRKRISGTILEPSTENYENIEPQFDENIKQLTPEQRNVAQADPVNTTDAYQPNFDQTPDVMCTPINVVDKSEACFLQIKNQSEKGSNTIMQNKPVYDQTPTTQYSCSFLAEVDKIEYAHHENIQKSEKAVHTTATNGEHNVDISTSKITTPSTSYGHLHPSQIDKKYKRPMRKTILGDVLRSPYVNRVMSLVNQRTKLENNISNFIFSAYGDPWDIVFKIENRAEIPRIVLESMRFEHCIHMNVVQLWAHILNFEERFKSRTSISRLFCTEIMLHRDTFDKNVAERNSEFTRNMDIVLADVGQDTLEAYELVFVPIICQQHFYLMCFNLKSYKVEIIDNSGTMPQMSVMKKYSGWAEKMNSFADYLIQKRHPSGRQIKNTKIHRLGMRWRTQFNQVDCGVFIMRHMETYRGNGLSDWDCGICNEDEVNNAQKNQLNDLRRKYAAKIILHEINDRKTWVLNDIKKYIQLPVEVRRVADDTAHDNIASRLQEHID